MDRLPPIPALRAFARQRGLTVGKARTQFRAELLMGRHSPRGIRFRYEGQPVDVQLRHQPSSTIPGGWTYVAGLNQPVGEWVPALDPPDTEPVPSGFLVLAAKAEGFADSTATITAHQTQYRHVTYLLDAIEPPQLAAVPVSCATTASGPAERAQLLRAAWVDLGCPNRAAPKVWKKAQDDNPDNVELFRSVGEGRQRRRLVAAAIKGAPFA